MKKRSGFTLIELLAVIVVLLMLMLIAVPSIGKLVDNAELEAYNQTMLNVENAALNFIADYKIPKPQVLNQHLKIFTDDLITNKYIDEIIDPRDQTKTCSGYMDIVNTGTNMHDTAVYLNCGGTTTPGYQDQYLHTVLKANTVSSGSGLYQVGSNYIFKGNVKNNYVLYDNQLWRIMNIDSSNLTKLILGNPTQNIIFDDRYNAAFTSCPNGNCGNSSYLSSDIFDATGTITYSTIFSTGQNFCIGSRDSVLTPTPNDNSLECLTTYSNNRGLATLSDYILASTSSGCSLAMDYNKSCHQNNYLALLDDWWVLTPYVNTYQAYIINNANSYYAASKEYVYKSHLFRPVISIKNTTRVVAGVGTKEYPFVLSL